MRSYRTILAVAAVVLFASAAAAEDYQWTLSSSAIDPYANVGVPTGGLLTLYLWLACSPVAGATALEGDILGPAGSVLAFSPAIPCLTYFVGSGFWICTCVNGPVPLGQFLVLSLPGQFCIVPTTSSQILTYDCQSVPQPHATAYIGFSNSGGTPCSAGTCPGPVSVDATPWGSVKGLYR